MLSFVDRWKEPITCSNYLMGHVLFHTWMFGMEISMHYVVKNDVQFPCDIIPPLPVVVVGGGGDGMKMMAEDLDEMRWDGADSAELDPGAGCDEPGVHGGWRRVATVLHWNDSREQQKREQI